MFIIILFLIILILFCVYSNSINYKHEHMHNDTISLTIKLLPLHENINYKQILLIIHDKTFNLTNYPKLINDYTFSGSPDDIIYVLLYNSESYYNYYLGPSIDLTYNVNITNKYKYLSILIATNTQKYFILLNSFDLLSVFDHKIIPLFLYTQKNNRFEKTLYIDANMYIKKIKTLYIDTINKLDSIV